MISRYGGVFYEPDNLNNPGSLDWVLEAIRYPIFGIDRYPTLTAKAAILCWVINEGHVFHDGNKRTSNMSCMLFLAVNEYTIEATQEEIIQVSEQIATCKKCNFTFEDYLLWVEARLKKLGTNI